MTDTSYAMREIFQRADVTYTGMDASSCTPGSVAREMPGYSNCLGKSRHRASPALSVFRSRTVMMMGASEEGGGGGGRGEGGEEDGLGSCVLGRGPLGASGCLIHWS